MFCRRSSVALDMTPTAWGPFGSSSQQWGKQSLRDCEIDLSHRNNALLVRHPYCSETARHGFRRATKISKKDGSFS